MEKIFKIYFQTAEIYHEELKKLNPIMVTYLKSRRINFKTCEKYMIGYSPQNSTFLLDLVKSLPGFKFEDWVAARLFKLDTSITESNGLVDAVGRSRIIFPIWNGGQVRAFSARTVYPNVEPKYKTVSYDFIPFFNSSMIKYNPAKLYIVEGAIDVLALDSINLSAIGLIGGNNFNSKHVEMLKGFKGKIVILLDSDRNNAGKKAKERIIKLLVRNGFTNLFYVDLPRKNVESKCDLSSLREKLTKQEFIDFISCLEEVKVNMVSYLKSELYHKDRDFYESNIEENISIIELASKFVEILNGNSALCPFHVDTNPSLHFYPETNSFHCFSCLKASEEVWTESGLKQIKDVKIGQKIYNIHGQLDTIVDKITKSQKICALKIGKANGGQLLMTDDHLCTIVDKDEIVKTLPYIIYRSENKNKIRYSSQYRTKKKSFKINFATKKCKDLNKGDFILFPIFPDQSRITYNLFNKSIIDKYSRGKKTERIKYLLINEELAYIYGLYIAEGSYCNRNIMFTFHKNESSFAFLVQKTIKKYFKIDSSIFINEPKNTRTVVISKVDLGKQLQYWFGKGVIGKKIPVQALHWPVRIQRKLIQGWLDGDSGTTISKELAFGMYMLAIQARFLPSIHYEPSHIGKDGVAHKEYWFINIKKRQSIYGFIENLNGIDYYLSLIQEICYLDNNFHEVIDITTSKSHTFLTKFGVVHNCNKSGRPIHFLMYINNSSYREARFELLKYTN